jgi:leucyl/phenylalanyl-tRNA--protein transferase
MIDCQQETGHLASLGAAPIPRARFLKHINNTIALPQIKAWEPIAPLAPRS